MGIPWATNTKRKRSKYYSKQHRKHKCKSWERRNWEHRRLQTSVRALSPTEPQSLVCRERKFEMVLALPLQVFDESEQELATYSLQKVWQECLCELLVTQPLAISERHCPVQMLWLVRRRHSKPAPQSRLKRDDKSCKSSNRRPTVKDIWDKRITKTNKRWNFAWDSSCRRLKSWNRRLIDSVQKSKGCVRRRNFTL